ncbi:metalloregulator ArsR/SmtB family transcription factor [Fictibacillus nanhaiensis]|jgi:DNA-binding transcriptional ArsR family regulator|uniref:ArsR/SmtB family transcription factor n=1 Tax=Fictibacillus nanhaiensis TaxID=742169 RepID=UPI002041DC5B|nr:metalloregulator ArsR/SmtB family transcription factor [Fictibacillus nanhaiensis]MCM3730362.1 metalloregulator ArsR/SmtB family transcription factor [Fictibacillus nanhaiensis]
MNGNPNIAEIASLLADPSRAEILISLLDGRFHTASELALLAKIKPQTASFHLTKLSKSKVIKMEKHGRFHYYHLANQEVAQLLESFLTISRPIEIRSFKQNVQTTALCKARTCYDHLAGKLGVGLTESMVKNGYLIKTEEQFEVTESGKLFFSDLGLNLSLLRKKRRSFSRVCLDWSERQHHLAGTLGSALASHFFDNQWITHIPSTRAVKITSKGKASLKRYFDYQL